MALSNAAYTVSDESLSLCHNYLFAFISSQCLLILWQNQGKIDLWERNDGLRDQILERFDKGVNSWAANEKKCSSETWEFFPGLIPPKMRAPFLVLATLVLSSRSRENSFQAVNGVVVFWYLRVAWMLLIMSQTANLSLLASELGVPRKIPKWVAYSEQESWGLTQADTRSAS